MRKGPRTVVDELADARKELAWTVAGMEDLIRHELTDKGELNARHAIRLAACLAERLTKSGACAEHTRWQRRVAALEDAVYRYEEGLADAG